MTDKMLANLVNELYNLFKGKLAFSLHSIMIINSYSITINKSRANIDSAFYFKHTANYQDS